MPENRCYPDINDTNTIRPFWLKQYVPAQQAYDKVFARSKREEYLKDAAIQFLETFYPSQQDNPHLIKSLIDGYINYRKNKPA